MTQFNLTEILPHHVAEAAEHNLTIVSANHKIVKNNDRQSRQFCYTYRCDQGHTFERRHGTLKRTPDCPACKGEETMALYSYSADAAGFEIVAREDAHNIRLRCRTCQTERTSHPSNLVRDNVVCKGCRDYSARPGHVYAIEVTVGYERFIKIGSTSNLYYRQRNMGLPDDAKVVELALVTHSNRNCAFAAERSLHEHFKDKRLSPVKMAKFMSTGGCHECYPFEMRDQLLAEIQ